ncbi:uncharacterized protein BXZ73DRAFT_81755 [Epithele typhae]|uniref:uncharacterized protein n=1 Tax=Epithele typhae TaxID=378194 RepID=UPI0020086903|nr:uncharacterized protein BXZ73DRAFT_81755 [Epithele typhae]KAH9914082.1 hypothetical protein BXZ73DRAFT_81755 [Epithele typhae]
MAPKSPVHRFKRALVRSPTSSATTRVVDGKGEDNCVHKTAFSQHPGPAGPRRTPTPLPDNVLARVFACFDPWDPDDQRTCLQAAFVCRAWSEPALAVVWSELPHLGPLWCVFLDDGSPKDKGHRAGMLMSILETGSFRDPTRRAKFTRLAKRVRSIGHVCITQEEGMILTELLGPLPLFPNLRRLTVVWYGNYSKLPADEQPFNSQVLCMCIPPTLSTLYIVGADENGDHFPDRKWLETCLDLIDDFAGASIREVTFSLLPHDALWAVAALKPFQTLRTVHVVNPISPSALRSLGTLEQLSTLIIGCSYAEDWDGITPVDLPTVRGILVGTGPPSIVSLLLDVLRAPRLLHIGFFHPDHRVGTLDGLGAVVAAVAASSISSTVLGLTLHVSLAPPTRADSDQTRPSVPRSRSSSIVQLHLHCHDPAALSAGDDDYLAISCAWPGLRDLIVLGCGRSARRDGPDPSRATHYHLAAHCPDLVAASIDGLAPFAPDRYRTKEAREAWRRPGG